MPANETSAPRLRPRSRSFRVFPGGTGVSSPARVRMRSELFTLITFELAGRRNWREGGHLPIIRARKQKVTGDLRQMRRDLWKLGGVAPQVLRSGAARTLISGRECPGRAGQRRFR